MKKQALFLCLLLIGTTGVLSAIVGLPPICPSRSSQAFLGPDDILGVWWSPDREGQMEFYRKNGKVFGRLIWSKYEVGGVIVKDIKNPVVSMRNNRLVGADFFRDLTYNAAENTYENGTVYDSRTGSHYNCTLWVESRDVLKVRGFIGFSVLGKTTTFLRVK